MSKVDFTVGYKFSNSELDKLKKSIEDAFKGIDLGEAIKDDVKDAVKSSPVKVDVNDLANMISKGAKGIEDYGNFFGETSKILDSKFRMYEEYNIKRQDIAYSFGVTPSNSSIKNAEIQDLYQFFKNRNATVGGFGKFTDVDEEKATRATNMLNDKRDVILQLLETLMNVNPMTSTMNLASLGNVKGIDPNMVRMIEKFAEPLHKALEGLNKGKGGSFTKYMEGAIFNQVDHDSLTKTFQKYLIDNEGFKDAFVDLEPRLLSNKNIGADVLAFDPEQFMYKYYEAKTGMGSISQKDIGYTIDNASSIFATKMKDEMGMELDEKMLEKYLNNIEVGFIGKSLSDDVNMNEQLDKLKLLITGDLVKQFEDVNLSILYDKVSAALDKRVDGDDASDIFTVKQSDELKGFVELENDKSVNQIKQVISILQSLMEKSDNQSEVLDEMNDN
jgi:hypothetical protein